MLSLYKEITPNKDANYYLFNALSSYKTALASKLVASVTLDSYRVNSNVIRVALSATITESVASTLTYAIDERTDENNVLVYFRCYLVRSVLIQSGYVMLTCEVDNWATYIMKADISNIRVTRCNRAIGVGLLDDIALTDGSPTKTYCATTGTSDEGTTANALMSRDNVSIVFALKYNIEQNNAGSVSHIRLYAFKLTALVTALYHANNDDANYLLVNPVELALDVVSGIYGIVGVNAWSILGTLNAVVLGAWLTDNVVLVGASNMQIKTKPNWNNWQDITLTPYEVVRSVATRTLTISNDPNNNYYVGTMQNGLKLARTTQASISVEIKTIPSNDKLTILACQGDNQMDITDSFAVTIGTTDGDVTAERQNIELLQNSVRSIAGAITIGKGIASGNSFATALGVTSMAGSFADELSKGRSSHLGNVIKGGDGAISYWRIVNMPASLDQPIRNAYIVNAYASIDDEAENLRMNGAKFDTKVSSLHTIKSSSLLGTGNVGDPTYLQASISISGIPTDAASDIKGALIRGIYLIDLI